MMSLYRLRKKRVSDRDTNGSAIVEDITVDFQIELIQADFVLKK